MVGLDSFLHTQIDSCHFRQVQTALKDFWLIQQKYLDEASCLKPQKAHTPCVVV